MVFFQKKEIQRNLKKATNGKTEIVTGKSMDVTSMLKFMIQVIGKIHKEQIFNMLKETWMNGGEIEIAIDGGPKNNTGTLGYVIIIGETHKICCKEIAQKLQFVIASHQHVKNC